MKTLDENDIAGYLDGIVGRSTLNKLNPKLRDWLLFACVAVAIPLVAAWELRTSDQSEAVVLGSSLLCLLAFYVYYGIQLRLRKRRAGEAVSKGFWCGVAALMIASGTVTIWAGTYIAARNSYLTLALSNKPLNDIYPARKRLVVELLRHRLANSIEEDKLIVEFRQHPIRPDLYSPESFATKEVITSVQSQFRSAVEADHEYFLKQQRTMKDFEQKMVAVDPAYLKSWENSETSEEQSNVTADRIEADWSNATISLYDFASRHINEISLKDGKLVFANEGVNLSFDEQESRCEAIHEKLLEIVHEEAKTHRKPSV